MSWAVPFITILIGMLVTMGGGVAEGPDGYVIRQSGEMVPYNDPRVKDSPDGEFHWCSRQGTDTGRTICLFVPPRGF